MAGNCISLPIQSELQVFSSILKMFALAGDLLQIRSQVLSFRGENTHLGGRIFVFITCLKQNFLGVIKSWGALPPNAPRG